jgi:anti-anti-sigma factor
MAEQTFHARGEYDMMNASELEAELLLFAHRNGGGPLTIDCGDLRFIDSSGIAALLRVREVLESERRALRVIKLRAAPRRVVEILGLQETLGVVNGS